MQQIDIDFDVFKALTTLRKHEAHSYNDVLRELLDLGPVHKSVAHPDSIVGAVTQLHEGLTRALIGPRSSAGFSSRGLFLPNGTRLRATYKKGRYEALIEDGRWIDEHGNEHSSPSAAATYLTGNSVNGWRFWEAKRPSDAEWRRLDTLV